MDGGLPVIFDQGHAHGQQFVACHKTLLCREIRQKDRFPKHCIRPVSMSAELMQDTVANNHKSAIPAEARAAYCRLYAHMTQEHFHCAQAVFDRLPEMGPGRQQLFDAVSGFIGGALFMGLTCSAFTAGVMAVGLQCGEIENSPVRVVRLLARMTFGGDAFDDHINKFNRTMNAGHRMSKWFAKEFGSTQCRAITGCDSSTEEGVQRMWMPAALPGASRLRIRLPRVFKGHWESLRLFVQPPSPVSSREPPLAMPGSCQRARRGVKRSWKP